ARPLQRLRRGGEPIVFLASRPLRPVQGHVHGPADGSQDLAGCRAGQHHHGAGVTSHACQSASMEGVLAAAAIGPGPVTVPVTAPVTEADFFSASRIDRPWPIRPATTSLTPSVPLRMVRLDPAR